MHVGGGRGGETLPHWGMRQEGGIGRNAEALPKWDGVERRRRKWCRDINSYGVWWMKDHLAVDAVMEGCGCHAMGTEKCGRRSRVNASWGWPGVWRAVRQNS
jgi:hypothetical protein